MSTSDRVFARLPEVYRSADPATGNALRAFIDAAVVGTGMEQAETDLLEFPRRLVEAQEELPLAAVEWLAQLLSVTFPDGADEALKREAVTSAASGFRSGTTAALEDAVRVVLAADQLPRGYGDTDAGGAGIRLSPVNRLDRLTSSLGTSQERGLWTSGAVVVDSTAYRGRALSVTDVDGGDLEALTAGDTVQVSPGQSWALSMTLRPARTTPGLRVFVEWRGPDSSTVISRSEGPAATGSASSYTTLTATGTAPAGAAYAAVGFRTSTGTLLAGDTIRVGRVDLRESVTPAFASGESVLRSDGIRLEWFGALDVWQAATRQRLAAVEGSYTVWVETDGRVTVDLTDPDGTTESLTTTAPLPFVTADEQGAVYVEWTGSEGVLRVYEASAADRKSDVRQQTGTDLASTTTRLSAGTGDVVLGEDTEAKVIAVKAYARPTGTALLWSYDAAQIAQDGESATGVFTYGAGARAAYAASYTAQPAVVRVRNFVGGDPWVLSVETIRAESPTDAQIIADAIAEERARPAGFTVTFLAFSNTWTDIEATYPTWTDWNAATWDDIRTG